MKQLLTKELENDRLIRLHTKHSIYIQDLTDGITVSCHGECGLICCQHVVSKEIINMIDNFVYLLLHYLGRYTMSKLQTWGVILSGLRQKWILMVEKLRVYILIDKTWKLYIGLADTQCTKLDMHPNQV